MAVERYTLSLYLTLCHPKVYSSPHHLKCSDYKHQEKATFLFTAYQAHMPGLVEEFHHKMSASSAWQQV